MLQPKFTLGQEVEFNHEVRTIILKNAINYWQNCKITNLIIHKDLGIGFPNVKDYPDLNEWVTGSRKVFGKIWGEKKDWIRHLMSSFDSRVSVIIVGMELCDGSSEHIARWNTCQKTPNYGWYKYKCLVTTPTGNHFYTWLLGSYLTKK